MGDNFHAMLGGGFLPGRIDFLAFFKLHGGGFPGAAGNESKLDALGGKQLGLGVNAGRVQGTVRLERRPPGRGVSMTCPYYVVI